jgi:ElaB/YqjD/DUF883 family membrane-anchored ribosome-binding protein
MDTYRNGIYGTDVKLPSGSEVEAATLHVPVGDGCSLHSASTSNAHEFSPERTGIRGKLDALKSQGLAKVQHLQHSVSERSASMKSNVNESLALVKSNVSRSVTHAKRSLRDGTTSRVADVQTSMRTSPMKWAGIAAGAGFGLGLLGRIAHWRNSHQRVQPSLIVIERSC